MTAQVHFFAGINSEINNHYIQKEYRNDIVVEIDNIFYEVYFYTASTVEYAMAKGGYISLPGLIIVETTSYEVIINSVMELIKLGYFDSFKGFPNKEIINNNFFRKWFITQDKFSDENLSSVRLDIAN